MVGAHINTNQARLTNSNSAAVHRPTPWLGSNYLQRRPRPDLSPGQSTTSHGARPPRAGALRRGRRRRFVPVGEPRRRLHRHGLGHVELHRNTCAGWSRRRRGPARHQQLLCKGQIEPCAGLDARRRGEAAARRRGRALLHGQVPPGAAGQRRQLQRGPLVRVVRLDGARVPPQGAGRGHVHALRALVRRRHRRRRRLDVRDDGERRRQCRARPRGYSLVL